MEREGRTFRMPGFGVLLTLLPSHLPSHRSSTLSTYNSLVIGNDRKVGSSGSAGLDYVLSGSELEDFGKAVHDALGSNPSTPLSIELKYEFEPDVR